ncbi:hypothetical protein [Streptococcus cristatus]|uniref:hypothetical protein n=1 Tax=Streptococcus cristatus TaxID=45634 RepID=UPI00165338E2|nr:hypothetical protein [Streptococcus cristatus]
MEKTKLLQGNNLIKWQGQTAYLIENEKILCEKPLQALSICGKIRVTEIRKGNQL